MEKFHIMKRLMFCLICLAVLLSACVGPTVEVSPEDPNETLESIETDSDSAVESVNPTATTINDTETPTLSPDDGADSSISTQKTSTPRPTSIPRPYGPDNFPRTVNPLTGLRVKDYDLLDRRPMAVKIQLYPRNGRPPWGVSLADIVFDYYQNDGLTRLNIIFYGNDAEKIGPIRSARLFDEHIMRMYKAIFAFGGADWRVYNRIYDADLRDLMVVEGKYNCPPMCREDPNGANYLVTNTEDLSEYIETERDVENERQDLNGMSFDTIAPSEGDPGEQVELRWSISAYVRWIYDEKSGRYIREQDTLEAYKADEEEFEPFEDRLTEEQISAANVIVLPLLHEDIYPDKNIEVIDIKLTGSGKAYLFRDGQVYQILWNRPASDSVLFLTDEDGNTIPFKPGNTWFEIVGASSLVSQPEEGVWRYEFRFP
jgi:hypothetical protein